MSQPKWKIIQHDADSCLRVDQTGVYPPELDLALEDEGEEETHFTVYTVVLEPLKLGDGRLLESNDHVPWFEDDQHWTLGSGALAPGEHKDDAYCPTCQKWISFKLRSAAQFAGLTPEDLRALLASDDVSQRAEGYRTLVRFHGYENFDSDPRTDVSQEDLDELFGHFTKTLGVHPLDEKRGLYAPKVGQYGCKVKQGDLILYGDSSGQIDYGRVLGYTWFDGTGKELEERMLVVLQADRTFRFGYIRFVELESVCECLTPPLGNEPFTRFFFSGEMPDYEVVNAAVNYGSMSNAYLGQYLDEAGKLTRFGRKE